MIDYSEIIEREYIILEIDNFIENATVDELKEIKKFIERLKKISQVVNKF